MGNTWWWVWGTHDYACTHLRVYVCTYISMGNSFYPFSQKYQLKHTLVTHSAHTYTHTHTYTQCNGCLPISTKSGGHSNTQRHAALGSQLPWKPCHAQKKKEEACSYCCQCFCSNIESTHWSDEIPVSSQLAPRNNGHCKLLHLAYDSVGGPLPIPPLSQHSMPKQASMCQLRALSVEKMSKQTHQRSNSS